MNTEHHRLVLGPIRSVPLAIELYRLLVQTRGLTDLPIVLTQTISEVQRAQLRQASIEKHGQIGVIGLHIGNFQKEYYCFPKPQQEPHELIQKMIEHNSELFNSLVDDHLGRGNILVVQSLKGVQDTDNLIIKLILRFTKDRLHLIDLI